MTDLTKICLRKICARGLNSQRRMMQHLQAYRRNDDGAMVFLTLYFFIMFLMLGGLGLAVMRHEMNRARLSVTTDAAVLAAAGMPAGSTVAEIKDVVEDYFAKNGLASNLNAIDTDGVGVDDIVTTVNSTKVTASASMTMDTYLMRLVGVDTLTANTAGTAQIATPKLEVSLVLDVSGSMSGDKIASLKVAAKEFVTTILNSSGPGDISISIIPFSMGVTPSDTIFDALNTDGTRDNSNCIVFLENEFGNSAINPAIPYRQQIFTLANQSNKVPFVAGKKFWRSCYMDDYIKILPYSMSETALHNKIDSLEARGNTSGHLGIKWGTALLDPSFQSVATALKATGEMDTTLTNVPSNWGEPESLKIIVMMGDGANTSALYFNDPNQLINEAIPESHTLTDYRGPGSDLYKIIQTGGGDPLYYLRNPNQTDPNDEKNYYDFANDDWLSVPEYENLLTQPNFDASIANNGTALTWEQAWGLITPQYYNNILNDSGPWDDYVSQEKVTGSMKDTRMQSSCTAAKNRGIVVYTIGFQVPKGGTAETQLSTCAQSVANYFPADTTTISSVFSTIASNVQNLRLTQ